MSQIGKSYAQALYSLAAEEQLTDLFLEQLNALETGIAAEPGCLQLLAAPHLPKAERCRILDDSYRHRVHPYILNFLKILTEKRYIRHFPDCCRQYREQYNEANGIVCVRAVSAVALREDQKSRLIQRLSQITGKTVALSERVDPACLGGIRLDYDGKRIDGTVQTRLDTLQRLLKNTVL